MASIDYHIYPDDLERLQEMSGIGVSMHAVDAPSARPMSPEEVQIIRRELGSRALESVGDDFAAWVQEMRWAIVEAARVAPDIVDILIIGYKMGITVGSGACMNDLGALYYLGDLVEQDYGAAAELYEMAADHGCAQGLVNLGYIYEYGRLGEVDHDRAFSCYALAAALAPNSEALYKLGDMFSRGRGTGRDRARARMLYERSYLMAEGPREKSQPAIRLAKMCLDDDGDTYGATFDPLRALKLYQVAEIGLRLDIDDGLTYYRRRLDEALTGQVRARTLLDPMDR